LFLPVLLPLLLLMGLLAIGVLMIKVIFC